MPWDKKQLPVFGGDLNPELGTGMCNHFHASSASCCIVYSQDFVAFCAHCNITLITNVCKRNYVRSLI